DQLADVAARRAGPLHARAEQRSGVGAAVLRRHEERVRERVVDEDEAPLRMGLREVDVERLPEPVRHCTDRGRAGREAQERGTVERRRHAGRRRTSQSMTTTMSADRATKSPASNSWKVQNRPAGWYEIKRFQP